MTELTMGIRDLVSIISMVLTVVGSMLVFGRVMLARLERSDREHRSERRDIEARLSRTREEMVTRDDLHREIQGIRQQQTGMQSELRAGFAQLNERIDTIQGQGKRKRGDQHVE